MKIGKLRLNKKHLVIIILIVIVISCFSLYFCSFDEEVFKNRSCSTEFYDRDGQLLRTFLSEKETYSEWCRLAEISPHFLRAIVLIEDRKFYSHHGIVASSLFRALLQNLQEERIVSGGSTITMQLAKLVYGHKKRTIINKVLEIFAALKFDLHISKTEILEEYVNRLPFGNMIYGIKEASHFYFDKDPSQLSLNQAIHLALLPKSPSRYNPKKHMDTLHRRWKIVLEIFKENHYINPDEYQRAVNEGITFQMKDYPFLGPHFIDLIKEKYFQKELPEKVHTTLDYSVQKELEGIIRGHLVRLANYNVRSAAAIIIDNHTHEVIGFMGSPDYFDHNISGFVNLATSLRQPGSSLKPFVYALALENGYTPATIIPDIKFPAKGGFFPKNHDGKEHGPLRLRIALACSYNIPAFYLAMKLKPQQVIKKLRQAGFSYIRNDPGFYGETIALGSGEVTLLDLVTAYSAFVNKGSLYLPVFIKSQPIKSQPLFDEKVAFLIWDILADPSARFASFGYNSSMNLPFPLAIKTGTSKGFRDNWAIGVNSEYTIGVWIGNPNGDNMKNIIQVGNASTILRDIFLAVQKDWTKGDIEIPAGIVKRTVCPLSGELVTDRCPDAVEEFFGEYNVPVKQCSYHIKENGELKIKYPELFKQWALRNNPEINITIKKDRKKWISFPQNGDFFYISDAISMKDQQITFEVMGYRPGESVDFFLDNTLYASIIYPETILWTLQRGEHTLALKSNGKDIDNIKFFVR